MDTVMYTTGCPKCRVLEAKLQSKGVSFTKNDDVEYMAAQGMQSLPYLEVDGKLMDFGEAVKWVNEFGD